MSIKLHWRDLHPNPLNELVRGDEGAEIEIEELAASIREEGIIQPLTVTESPGGPTPYRIVTGERRWRAARALGEDAPLLPCRVIEAGDEVDQLVIMGIENLQRHNLGPVAEAKYYQALLERGLDEKSIARRTGQQLARIKWRLKLLEHPAPIQTYIESGRLQIQAAQHLAQLEPAQQVELAGKMLGRSARDIALAVKLIKRQSTTTNGNGSAPAHEDRPGKRDEINTLRELATRLAAQIRADALLLERCADGLAAVDPELSMAAFERAEMIQGAIRKAINGNGC